MVAAARPQGRQALSVAVTVDTGAEETSVRAGGSEVAQETSRTAQTVNPKKKLLKS
jgi:hypothetical protein